MPGACGSRLGKSVWGAPACVCERPGCSRPICMPALGPEAAAAAAAAAAPGLRLGRGGGSAKSTVPGSFSAFAKNFCAWLRICTAVLVPM